MAYSEQVLRTLRQRWRSGNHVGAQKPQMRAYVRTVKLRRRFRTVPRDEVYAFVPGLEGGARTVWKGMWKPKTAWVPLPNVGGYQLDQDFDSNGIAQTTIDIDNVGMEEETGPGGVFHRIVRGFMSPWRGRKPRGRPAVGTVGEWYDILNDKSTQIILLGGYGDTVIPIFEGLVNDFDISSRPDKISLICRDGGQTLSDQNVFINAKVRNVRDPITFCDRQQAFKMEAVGGGAEASDSAPGHNARFVLDDTTDTEWKSADRDHQHPGDLPWIQIRIPNGHYQEINLHPRYDGMQVFVAIKEGDWIDEGNGNVDGTAVPWVAKVNKARARRMTIKLPRRYQLADNTIVRLYFSNLDYGQATSGAGRAYRAGVAELRAMHMERDPEAKKWIIVDDLADVVRTVFQWCGLNDWEVETTGVRLKDKVVFNRSNKLMDIINGASEQVGYAFHMRPRESFDEDDLEQLDEEASMGIAVWRQNQSMRRGGSVRDPVELVHEDQTLTGINAHFTDEPLATVIRVRGKEKRKKDGGRTLGGDRIERAMYVYLPVWARFGDQYRNANIKKYVVHHDEQLRNGEECEIAALFIAYREALESAQAQFECPCMPTIFLDAQCAVYDTGTGISSRIWVALRQISYQGGANGHFRMSLGGPMLDLPDIEDTRQELRRSLHKRGYDPGLSPWEKENYGHVYEDDYR